MKKTRGTHEKKSLKRQLLSGTIYVALAAVVVAVAVNTTVGLISDKTQVPQIDNTSESLRDEIPSVPSLPKLTIPDITVPKTDDGTVSGVMDGINSDITETIPEPAIMPSENIVIGEISIPEDANLGLDRFIKPCNGYVSKGHSTDMPVYSITMSDYRTHTGVDIVEEPATPIVCVSGGVVSDIYNDDLYGMTVEIKNRDGYTVRYSNLLPTLSSGVEVGAILKTGDNIGGIGETALCESLETSHLHLEIYNPEGVAVNPEDLISF